MQLSLNDTSKEENAVTAFLHGQDVGGVGQLALLCGRNSLSVTQRSVAVWVPKGRVVLPVAQPGKGETQQRPHQHILPVVFVVAGSGEGDHSCDE